MKLLFCEDCGSIFSLSINKEKTCDCGKVKGKYNNRSMATTNGKGIALAIGTGDLQDKMIKISCDDQKKERSYYLEHFRLIAWIRPHEGLGNPHTIVE